MSPARGGSDGGRRNPPGGRGGAGGRGGSGAGGRGGSGAGGGGGRSGGGSGRGGAGGRGGTAGGPTGGRGQGRPGARAGSGRPSAGRPSAGRPATTAGRLPRPGGEATTGRRPTRRDAPVDGGLGGDQVEGRRAVRELLVAGRRTVHNVSFVEDLDENGPLGELRELARAAGIPVRALGRARLAALAGTDAPQGVVAIADPVQPVELEALTVTGATPPLLVVLDGVTDPHNVGAIMRTALCAGATGLVVARHRSAHLSPSAVKAAAGAVEHLPVALVSGVPAALSELKEAGVWTVGLAEDADRPLWDLEVATEPVALVLGAEGEGLSRLSRQRCELVVGIPLVGPLGSLNVSAAGALACFEVARRRSALSALD